MKRWLLRIIWFLMSALVILSAGMAVWMYRARPQYEGEIKVGGLSQPITLARDDAEVVHVQASSLREAAFGLGFAHAQDRSWQLEFNRRLMHGELSEILGDATLPTDKLIRALGIRQAAQRQYDNLPPDVRDWLKAYSDGIQAFYAHRTRALPPEFTLLRTQPGGKSGVAWDPVDSVAWTLMMALDLGGNWGNEFARLSAAKTLATQRLWQIYPPYKGEQPASNVDFAKLYRDLGVYRENVPTQTSWSLPVIGEPGFNEGRGSNNWVIAGSHSQTGMPLLANDPHLALSAPAIWYFAHLQAPSLNVIGASLPGLPVVVLGHNERTAWGFTNTGPDVQDLYLEQIDPQDATRYKTPQGWANFETRRETIPVKGKADVTLLVRSTRHGPVISDVQASYGELINTDKFAVALRWAALDEDNQTLISAFKVQTAQSVPELIAAYENNHSPMQNVVMADVDGRIAYKAAGRVPLRKPENDIKGVAPSLGWDARYDWSGWIPYAQTPQDGGDKGWIATANQRITPAGYPYFMGQDWTAPHRFDRIEQVLGNKERHSLQDMKDLQADVVSLSTQALLPVLKASHGKHLLTDQALKALEGFDGAMRAQAAAPLIFAVWSDELTRGLLMPKMGESLFKAQYGKRNFRVFLEQVMQHKNDWWCEPLSCAEQSSAALDRALDRIVSMQGDKPNQWQWGKSHVALSSHRPFGQVPVLRDLFNVKVESAGDPFTVNVGQYWAGEAYLPFATRHAASMRAIYDLSNLENSVFIYQTGQSGLVWDSSYQNLREPWSKGEYHNLTTKNTKFNYSLVINN
jgi:penicillin amidase